MPACFSRTRNSREAQNALEDLRATRPDYVPGLMLLCRVLRAQQKYLPAIDVYKEIGAIAPCCPEALFERAETHLENGQPYWAELFYQRTLKVNPRHAHAELGLARVANCVVIAARICSMSTARATWRRKIRQ